MWYKFEFRLDYAENKLDVFVDGEHKETFNIPDKIGRKLRFTGADNWITNSGFFYNYIDNIRVRKYSTPEPTFALSEDVFSFKDSETPGLSLNIDIDTQLKQGEIRKGTLKVKNEGNADAKSVKVKLSSESLGINVEKSYDKIPAGEAREFVFEVNANDAGTFKLSAYAEYWDDEGNKYIETSEEYIHVEAVGDVTEEKSITPGFEAIFAIIGLILVTYTYLRKEKR